MNFDKNNVHKILIIKPEAIGDVLLATPVIENLRHNFPDAQINFLTRSYCAEVLIGNPYLDRVLTFNINASGGDSSLCLIRNIHKQKYDLIIDLFGNPRTAIIVFNSDAKYRIGYRFKWRALAYNIKIKPRGSVVHNIEFNLDSLHALGLEIITSKPSFYLNAVHTEFADEFFERNNLNNSPVIGMNPSGTWQTKVWPAEKFAELGKKLSSGNNRILLFWGYGEEKTLAGKIAKEIGDSALLIPETDIKYMGSLAKKCSLFITNDTGPMHIAWVLGVNVAAIFGPTNSKLQGPLSKNSVIIRNEELSCLGCNLTKVSDCPYQHKCMKNLSVEYVYDKILKSGFLK
ncbi:MAG: glycosyltransferase family 9 protein [Ignavibacteria bacterium]|nr:glycosyltransferase family 9 protein [Ignavibacteria bacterium]MCC7159754.1 glycosyltransferase family 9 protein [Ignavibacteria bacterium]